MSGSGALSFCSLAAAGFAVLLTSHYIEPAGASFGYRDVHSELGAHSTLHNVNRAEKADRLATSKTAVQAPASRRPQKILVGCDAAFSNLSAHASLNFARSCLS